jgi:SRSO17 transposase
LLSPLERKNGWTIAEHAGEPEPKALQRFLNLSPWDADELLNLNREYAMEHLAAPGGILVADPTGFPKKGTHSVGVQRQYSGTLGRIDNCQIATFLAYVTPDRDRVLIDRRLYLPKESWMADPARCAAAGIPAEVTFATRPEQVIEMIQNTRAAGVPFAWFTADEEFAPESRPVRLPRNHPHSLCDGRAENHALHRPHRNNPPARHIRLTDPPERLATPRLRYRLPRVPGL